MLKIRRVVPKHGRRTTLRKVMVWLAAAFPSLIYCGPVFAIASAAFATILVGRLSSMTFSDGSRNEVSSHKDIRIRDSLAVLVTFVPILALLGFHFRDVGGIAFVRDWQRIAYDFLMCGDAYVPVTKLHVAAMVSRGDFDLIPAICTIEQGSLLIAAVLSILLIFYLSFSSDLKNVVLPKVKRRSPISLCLRVVIPAPLILIIMTYQLVFSWSIYDKGRYAVLSVDHYSGSGIFFYAFISIFCAIILVILIVFTIVLVSHLHSKNQ